MQKHSRITKNGHSTPRQVFTKATLRALNATKDRGSEVLHNTEDLVRSNPVAAIGIAFASGVMLAVVLRLFSSRD